MAKRNAHSRVVLVFLALSVLAAAPVHIESKAKHEKDQKEFASLTTKSNAVLARMGKQFKDPCANPDATVKWLRAQPEVTVANNHEGHNLSFTVGWLPFMVSCHRK